MAARKIHERVNIAAEVGPLSGSELALDGDEEPDRRAEELEIALLLGEPGGVVIARDLA